MRLAQSSQKTIEDFFKFYLNDETFQLPKMKFYSSYGTRILTNLMQIHGITIGKKIFITPKLLFVNSQSQKSLPDDLVVHEIAHVLQYRAEGFWTFLYKYLREYWLNLGKEGSYGAKARSLAYYNISYEREARDAAAKFLNWKSEKF